jgi:hypothetical protein
MYSKPDGVLMQCTVDIRSDKRNPVLSGSKIGEFVYEEYIEERRNVDVEIQEVRMSSFSERCGPKIWGSSSKVPAGELIDTPLFIFALFNHKSS